MNKHIINNSAVTKKSKTNGVESIYVIKFYLERMLAWKWEILVKVFVDK